MHIMITGGTGFIGQALTQYFLDTGHQISIVGRSEQKITERYDGKVTALTWEGIAPKAKDILSGVHCLINLTGANIGDKKWTEKRQQTLLESRVETTTYLAKLCASLGTQAPLWINASGVGIYGTDTNDEAHTEDSPLPQDRDDFLSSLGAKWEDATAIAEEKGVRVVKLRLGAVIGDGGMMTKLASIFQFGFGGPIGGGQQDFCWVSLHDVVRAIDFIIKHDTLAGPINVVAPAHNTQGEFATALGKAMGRPACMPTPAWVIQCLYGQMGDELILHGQKVIPDRLQQENFTFEHANLDAALAPLYQKASTAEPNPPKAPDDDQQPPQNI
jgi:uncharacterized protein